MARTDTARFNDLRLAFPNLAKPQRNAESGVEEFNCVLIMEKGSPVFQELAKAVAAVGVEEYGPEARQDLKDHLAGKRTKYKWPFIDGTQGNYKDRPGFGEGMVFVRAKTRNAPQVVGKNPKVRMSEADIVREGYPGCYVNGLLHAWSWEHKTNGKGVSIGLDAIQIARDGERISSGGVDASNGFEDLSDGQGDGGAGDVFNGPVGDEDVPF